MVRTKNKKTDRSGQAIRYSAMILTTAAIVFCAVFTVRAWVEPSASPPGGNIAAPLHTGSTTQTKQGSLSVSGAGGYGIYAQGSSYGVYGYNTSSGVYGLLGYAGYGGYFNGPTYTNSYSYSAIMYDSNNGGYYVDPNGTSRLNYTVNDNVYSYGWIYSNSYLQAPQICIGGDCRSGWPSSADTLQDVTNRGNTTTQPITVSNYIASTNYLYSYGYYYWPNTNYGFVGANVYADTINTGYSGDPLELNYYRSGPVTTADMRADIFYDRSNTGYYLDPNYYSNVYAMQPVYSFNGPVYDWNNGGYYIDPSSTSRLNYGVYDNVYSYGWMQAPIIYDSQNTGYYLDPNGSSRLNQLYYVDSAYIVDFRPQYMYDWNDTNYYIDMNSGSRFNYLGRNYGWNWTEYDWNDTNYYMDLNNVSILNDLRVNILYDRQNTGYYVDPNYYSNVYAMQPAYSFNGPVYDWNNGGYYLDPSSYSRLNYPITDNIYNYGEVNSDTVRARSQLCIGNDCRSSWPSGGSQPVATGLYGYCKEYCNFAGRSCSDATSPAYCDSQYQPACACPSGYSLINLNGVDTSGCAGSGGTVTTTYSCLKN